MKSSIFTISLLVTASILMLTQSCKKDETTVKDIEGNVYKTVVIGTQVWMAENLKTKTYRNGDPINLVSLDRQGLAHF